ncbi:MAG: hypothetical protein A4E62_00511 [Syntrophorhabdus sp. PtaU1.Bin002]|nr:MAG: hypothetical protein A4E58_01453 [Syntrophorhabdus sp. PtaB.Bin006]OPY73386.1 MAG: hypothetical protein A4E62_00511 [Syntrophorhabdus sp. PtaU1.Bin002]
MMLRWVGKAESRWGEEKGLTVLRDAYLLAQVG